MGRRREGIAPDSGCSYAGGMRSEVNPRLADIGLAIAMALVLAVVVASDPVGRGAIGSYAFALGFGLLLLFRRRLPRTVLIVTLLAIFAYYTLDLPPVGMVLPATGALFSAAEQRRTVWAVGAAAVLLAVATYFRLDGSEPGAALNGYTFVTELALAAAAIALGAAVRLAREARERSARIAALTASEEALAAAGRMQAERVQMARDLHDAIGHTLSVAALHASVAAEATDAVSSRAALDQVRAATTDALRELRRTVKVLRADRQPETAPPLGLASIDTVIDTARAAGLRVETELSVASDALSRSVDAAAFRIVQESVTNVLRHADAATVRITARAVDGVLSVRVTDDGRAGSRRAATVPGAGIRGMKERAALLGGTLDAHPAPGGFVVAAEIPTRAEGAA